MDTNLIEAYAPWWIGLNHTSNIYYYINQISNTYYLYPKTVVNIIMIDLTRNEETIWLLEFVSFDNFMTNYISLNCAKPTK